MEEKEYEDFFNKIRIFQEEQKKQKKRGLNDYNLLTTVLKYHDEVRLHSRMIGSLLDVKGKHYQDELFLEKFLKIVGIKNYDVKNSKILLEYENIDLYLTDGINHIIIENKIWAEDQEAQIERYINIIKNKDIETENLYVLYLSINRAVPSGKSLGDLKIINNNVICNKNNEEIAQYRAVRYKIDIINWLEQCQYEVQNITNLNEAIKQYKGVVEMVNGDYESKVKNMEKIILKDEYNLKVASDIYNNFEIISKNIVKDFFTITLIKEFQKKLGESDKYTDWKIEVDKNIVDKAYSYPIKIFKNKNWDFVFTFSFEVKNMNRGYWAIINKKHNNDKNALKTKYLSLFESKKSKTPTSTSILWNYNTKFMHSYDSNNLKKFQFDKENTVNQYYKYFTDAMKMLEDSGSSLEELNK